MILKEKTLYLGIKGEDIVVTNAPCFSDNTKDKQGNIIPSIREKLELDDNDGFVTVRLSDGNTYELNWRIEKCKKN